MWNLVRAYDAAVQNHPLPDPVHVMSGQGSVDAVVISDKLGLLAVCAGQEIHVFELRTLKHAYRYIRMVLHVMNALQHTVHGALQTHLMPCYHTNPVIVWLSHSQYRADSQQQNHPQFPM